jgi:hypothetical protein
VLARASHTSARPPLRPSQFRPIALSAAVSHRIFTVTLHLHSHTSSEPETEQPPRRGHGNSGRCRALPRSGAAAWSVSPPHVIPVRRGTARRSPRPRRRSMSCRVARPGHFPAQLHRSSTSPARRRAPPCPALRRAPRRAQPASRFAPNANGPGLTRRGELTRRDDTTKPSPSPKAAGEYSATPRRADACRAARGPHRAPPRPSATAATLV